MGEAELDNNKGLLTITAHIVTYGNASTPELAKAIAEEVKLMWNEPDLLLTLLGRDYRLVFETSGEHRPEIDPLEVISCTDPTLNFFRIEDFAVGNISFVDGLGCNTGYFKTENLYAGSTTAAHEFGHSLGLPHPEELDIRGKGRPGIMYPRGTWVDPPYQYDSTAQPGAPGGTMHPMHRRVNIDDIANLNLHKLEFKNGKAIVGAFTNMWHEDHSKMS
jgi:hypothetical protein